MKKEKKSLSKKRLLDKGVFPITSGITPELIDELKSWVIGNRPDKNKLTILIASRGGSPSPVIRFASFTSVLSEKFELEGVAIDTCGSSALALLQCCDKRIAVKHTAFFIHHMSTTIKVGYYYKDREKIIKDTLESCRNLEDELISLQCKRTGLSKKEWMKLADYGEKDCDTPIFTDQALKLGLIDKVVDSYPCL